MKTRVRHRDVVKCEAGGDGRPEAYSDNVAGGGQPARSTRLSPDYVDSFCPIGTLVVQCGEAATRFSLADRAPDWPGSRPAR